MDARQLTFWRRRLVALAVPALLAGVTIGALAGDDNEKDAASESQDNAQLPEREIRLKIAVSGDLLIHGPVAAQALAYGNGERYQFRPMLEQVRQIVRDADLGICHLEQPLTAGVPSGEPVFQAPQGLAGAIAWTGWDACSTASNHSLDGGLEGIDFTLKKLDGVGVAHSGTNASPTAPRAATVKAKGIKVALLAYTDLIPGLTPPEEDWRLNMAEPERMLADAREARRNGADVVLVSLHWGIEYQHEPSAFQREVARQLTASPDVTAVIGQHVHVVQPIKRVNGKPVVFGEGNLLSNQTANCCVPESQDGMVVVLDVRAGPEGVSVNSVRYVPTEVAHPSFEIVRASGESRERTISYAGRRPWLKPTP
ncbi:MAG: CapA family protein [Actinomycetota bacterium]|nr:CapA family protein [Actinomycetota bacterium]